MEDYRRDPPSRKWSNPTQGSVRRGKKVEMKKGVKKTRSREIGKQATAFEILYLYANRYLDLDIIIDYVKDGGDELEIPDKQTNTYS